MVQEAPRAETFISHSKRHNSALPSVSAFSVRFSSSLLVVTFLLSSLHSIRAFMDFTFCRYPFCLLLKRPLTLLLCPSSSRCFCLHVARKSPHAQTPAFDENYILNNSTVALKHLYISPRFCQRRYRPDYPTELLTALVLFCPQLADRICRN